jgi:hypothetical protein
MTKGGWDQDFMMLTDPTRGDEQEEHLTGGGLTPWPARWRITRQEALDAVLYFCEKHVRDPARTWGHSLAEP